MELLVWGYKRLFDTEKSTIHGKIYFLFRNEFSSMTFWYPYDFPTRILNVGLICVKLKLGRVKDVVLNLMDKYKESNIKTSPLDKLYRIPFTENFLIQQLEELIIEYKYLTEFIEPPKNKDYLQDYGCNWAIYRLILSDIVKEERYLIKPPTDIQNRLRNFQIINCLTINKIENVSQCYKEIFNIIPPQPNKPEKHTDLTVRKICVLTIDQPKLLELISKHENALYSLIGVTKSLEDIEKNEDSLINEFKLKLIQKDELLNL
jgi:hypothetical protein